MKTPYKIPFLDLSVKDPQFKEELLNSVNKVLTHGRIVLGPEVDEFEDRIASICQKTYAVGVNSGTDALYLALRALGIGPGDEVITTSLSWIATANAISLCGARPIFVDITTDLTIDAELIEEAITSKTKAILPVHFTGRLCEMDKIISIADKYNLYLVEDAAPAFGASYKGAKSGSFGHISAFSMNPMKVFNSYGEAGAVVTDDKSLYEKVLSLRYAGTLDRENCVDPSVNGRIDTIQASMLLVSLNRLSDKISRRRTIAKLYNNILQNIVDCPKEYEGYFNVYYTYTILAEKRDELQRYLENKGVETKVQHPILMPYHTAYKGKFKVNIPVCEKAVNRIVCLPNHEDLSMEEVAYVCKHIRDFYSK